MKNFGSHGCIKTKSSPNPYSRIWRTHFLGLNRKESEKVLIFQCPRKVRMIFSANRSKGPPCAAGGVSHRSARPGPAGRRGKNHPRALRSGIFSCRALTLFRRENGCKAFKETRVPAPRAGCLTDKSKRIWQQKT